MKTASVFSHLDHDGSDHADIVKPLYKHVSILLVIKSQGKQNKTEQKHWGM